MYIYIYIYIYIYTGCEIRSDRSGEVVLELGLVRAVLVHSKKKKCAGQVVYNDGLPASPSLYR